jgi:branched-chain amino acid transport system substrate-binding protein
LSVSSVAKANKIAFIVPVSETARCAAPQMIHPYLFPGTSNTDVEGLAKAILMARRKDVNS